MINYGLFGAFRSRGVRLFDVLVMISGGVGLGRGGGPHGVL